MIRVITSTASDVRAVRVVKAKRYLLRHRRKPAAFVILRNSFAHHCRVGSTIRFPLFLWRAKVVPLIIPEDKAEDHDHAVVITADQDKIPERGIEGGD